MSQKIKTYLIIVIVVVDNSTDCATCAFGGAPGLPGR